MSYRVVVSFYDKQDDMYLYRVGDTYPRAGVQPSAERIDALETGNNANKQKYITKEGDGEDGCDVCNSAGHSDADPTADDGGAGQSRKSPANRKRKAKNSSK